MSYNSLKGRLNSSLIPWRRTMEKIRQALRNPLILFIVCLVIGLLVGIFVLGYGCSRFNGSNSGAFNLRPDLQEDWLRAAIDSYSVNQDLSLAVTRYNDLGSDAPDTLATVRGCAWRPGSTGDLCLQCGCSSATKSAANAENSWLPPGQCHHLVAGHSDPACPGGLDRLTTAQIG